MVFWFGIFVGGLFAWFAIGIGFYETWTMLFNIIISIYLAIFMGLIIVDIPAVSDTPYSNALTMVAIAIASFAILHGISYTFLTGQFKVSFPRIFDTLGTGFLGFLAGFLLWNFVGFLIFTTPISQNDIVKDIGFDSQFKQSNVSYVSWWCNLVNTVVSSQENKITAEQAIGGPLKSAEKKERPRTTRRAEPEKPVESAEPNDVEADISEQKHLAPTPEAGVEDI